MMDTQTFISNYREAFGERPSLPILFYYSDTPLAQPEKSGGCLFKRLAEAKEGKPVSFNAETLTCPGGRLYTGFSPLPEHVPTFVSQKERYKETPQDVVTCVNQLDIRPASHPYLNFVRIDKAESFDVMEGLLFFATPDILSGLTMWTYFDNNAEDAVSAPFGAGCTTTITYAIRENRQNGQRTFIGLFDPSARAYIAPDELSFVIPASRFSTMSQTMRRSCLFDSAGWKKVRERINKA